MSGVADDSSSVGGGGLEDGAAKRFALVPHDQHTCMVSQHVVDTDGEYHALLLNSMSGETWRITSRNAVRFGYSIDGHAWLKANGCSQWLWPHCEYLVFTDGVQRYIQRGQDAASRIPLCDDMVSHRPCELSLFGMARGYGDVSISGACFCSPAAGGSCFWNLGDVFQHFEMDERGVASRWMHDRWAGWSKQLQRDFGLAGHLRKAKPTKALAETQGSEPQRVLNFNSVSTHGLLALFCRWTMSTSEATGRISNTNGRAKLEAFWRVGCKIRRSTSMLSSLFRKIASGTRHKACHVHLVRALLCLCGMGLLTSGSFMLPS